MKKGSKQKFNIFGLSARISENCDTRLAVASHSAIKSAPDDITVATPLREFGRGLRRAPGSLQLEVA